LEVYLYLRDYYAAEPRVTILSRPEELKEVELLEVTKYHAPYIRGDIIIQTQVNKPLTTAKVIDDCLIEFFRGGYNSLFTVQKIDTSVNWEYQKDRQSSKGNYKSCAVVKIWDKPTLLRTVPGTWGFGTRHYDYTIPQHHIEIDTIEDYRLAEAYKLRGY
jgi:CMP-N-acetylneuraminic acid synthetase